MRACARRARGGYRWGVGGERPLPAPSPRSPQARTPGRGGVCPPSRPGLRRGGAASGARVPAGGTSPSAGEGIPSEAAPAGSAVSPGPGWRPPLPGRYAPGAPVAFPSRPEQGVPQVTSAHPVRAPSPVPGGVSPRALHPPHRAPRQGAELPPPCGRRGAPRSCPPPWGRVAVCLPPRRGERSPPSAVRGAA